MKKIIFILSFIVLFVIIFYRTYYIKNRIFGLKVITEENFKELIKEKEEITSDIPLYFNGSKITYIKSEDYYFINQKSEDSYVGNITCESSYNIKVVKPNKVKTDIIKNNECIQIIVYNDANYKVINLKMTTLPIVTISNVGDKSSMQLFNCEGGSYIKDYYINYNIRGASVALANKKSYKVNLVNSKGNRVKKSLLGMREDNDWILNPIYFDNSMIREKIGYDIWNEMSDKYNHTLEYVELIIDGEYRGVYYLQEPVDAKTFNKNDNDVLISIKWWNFLTERTLFNDNLTITQRMDEFELDKKDVIENKVEALREFVKDIETEEKSKIIEYDIDNITNYELFINLIFGLDNVYINEKILLDYSDEKYLVSKTPWDLDRSLWNDNIDHSQYSYNTLFKDLAVNKSIKDDLYYDLMKTKYFNLRSNIFNMEYLNNLIDTYTNLLENSGAYTRNSVKWNNQNYEESVNVIRQYFEQRIPALDDIMEGY